MYKCFLRYKLHYYMKQGFWEINSPNREEVLIYKHIESAVEHIDA